MEKLDTYRYTDLHPFSLNFYFRSWRSALDATAHLDGSRAASQKRSGYTIAHLFERKGLACAVLDRESKTGDLVLFSTEETYCLIDATDRGMEQSARSRELSTPAFPSLSLVCFLRQPGRIACSAILSLSLISSTVRRFVHKLSTFLFHSVVLHIPSCYSFFSSILIYWSSILILDNGVGAADNGEFGASENEDVAFRKSIFRDRGY